jgi:GNAT superfamily N-acetyltransferase
MIIQTYVPEDKPYVLALWEKCGLCSKLKSPEADIETALKTPNCELAVGKIDEAVMASLLVGFDGHRGWIYYLAVAPDHQSTGRGATLLKWAEEWLKRRDCRRMLFMVEPQNGAALKFYQNLGYERSPMVLFAKPLT